MKQIAQVLSLGSTGHNYSGGTQKKGQFLPLLISSFPQCPLTLRFRLNLNREIRGGESTTGEKPSLSSFP